MGLDLGVGYGFGDDNVRFGHVKVFLDGSLLGATAAVTESFAGTITTPATCSTNRRRTASGPWPRTGLGGRSRCTPSGTPRSISPWT